LPENPNTASTGSCRQTHPRRSAMSGRIGQRLDDLSCSMIAQARRPDRGLRKAILSREPF